MLNQNHIEDLELSGLSAETIQASKCFSVAPEQAAGILGFPVGCPALAFPYPETASGNGRAYMRLKPDTPFQPPGWNKSAKYLAPVKSKNRLYVPPTLNGSSLQDTSLPLFLTEGEKKALKAVEDGFPCVSFSGVWNWTAGRDPGTGQRHVIPDVGKVKWDGRTVYLCYDSDATANPGVLAAEREIARELQARGADVRIVRLPDLSGLKKTGLDDFLHRKGAEALLELMSKAEPVAARSYSLSDDGNADRLVDRQGKDLRYCYELGWLVWDGRRWIEDRTGEVRRRAVDTAKGIGLEAAAEPDPDKASNLFKHAGRCLSDAKIKAMLSSAESKLPLPVVITDFDTDPFLFNVLNGTLDLRTGKLREHQREDLLQKLAPVEYDPEAECPTWRSFLDRIMEGNLDLITFLQKAAGYSLTGSTAEECLFILHGGGQNGKSTFLETVKALCGDYGLETQPDTLMLRRDDSGSHDVARLRGARFVAAVETEENRRLAESRVKHLVGGDTVVARHLYRESFEFQPQFKIWIGCNHRPVIKGTDYAIWRRIRLVPFAVQIPEAERDPTLKGPEGKLQTELSGILNWALEGCLRWLRERLRAPDEVKRATEGYRNESDTIGAFLDECCLTEPGVQVLSKVLYAAYVKWCESNGERPVRQTDLGMKLTERGFKKVRIGHGGPRGWNGIGLLSPYGDTVTHGDTENRKVEMKNPHGDFSENSVTPRHRVTRTPPPEAEYEDDDLLEGRF